jgi:hypothetical protein
MSRSSSWNWRAASEMIASYSTYTTSAPTGRLLVVSKLRCLIPSTRVSRAIATRISLVGRGGPIERAVLAELRLATGGARPAGSL